MTLAMTRSEFLRSVLAAFAFGVGASAPSIGAASETMDAASAREKAVAGEILLIDIRTPAEWASSGVADAAHTLDMQDPDFVKKLSALAAANPGKPLAMMCATGARSSYVVDALERAGATNVVNVVEGMMGSKAGPGWLRRGLPVRRPDAPIVCDDC